MPKIEKIINGNYIGANKYTITDTANGKKEINFSPDTVLEEGTPIGAELLNEIQRNGIYYLQGTKRVVGQIDIYDCDFIGTNTFDFTQLITIFTPNSDSTNSIIQLNLDGDVYTVNTSFKANEKVGLILVKADKKAYSWVDGSKKLNKGNLPATIPNGETIFNLLENNGGINIDTTLLYLNDVGTKTQGKVYFDKNKKGLFECIKTTTSTVNSITNFVDISNKASSDRLDNLKLIGSNQKYYNVTSTRNFNKNFKNDTDRTIVIIISTVETRDSGTATAYVDEIAICNINNAPSSAASMTFIVPANSIYRVDSTDAYNMIKYWIELK